MLNYQSENSQKMSGGHRKLISLSVIVSAELVALIVVWQWEGSRGFGPRQPGWLLPFALALLVPFAVAVWLVIVERVRSALHHVLLGAVCLLPTILILHLSVVADRAEEANLPREFLSSRLENPIPASVHAVEFVDTEVIRFKISKSDLDGIIDRHSYVRVRCGELYNTSDQLNDAEYLSMGPCDEIYQSKVGSDAMCTLKVNGAHTMAIFRFEYDIRNQRTRRGTTAMGAERGS